MADVIAEALKDNTPIDEEFIKKHIGDCKSKTIWSIFMYCKLSEGFIEDNWSRVFIKQPVSDNYECTLKCIWRDIVLFQTLSDDFIIKNKEYISVIWVKMWQNASHETIEYLENEELKVYVKKKRNDWNKLTSSEKEWITELDKKIIR